MDMSENRFRKLAARPRLVLGPSTLLLTAGSGRGVRACFLSVPGGRVGLLPFLLLSLGSDFRALLPPSLCPFGTLGLPLRRSSLLRPGELVVLGALLPDGFVVAWIGFAIFAVFAVFAAVAVFDAVAIFAAVADFAADAVVGDFKAFAEADEVAEPTDALPSRRDSRSNVLMACTRDELDRVIKA